MSMIATTLTSLETALAQIGRLVRWRPAGSPPGRRARGAAMRITRTFTAEGTSPYDGIEFRTACSEIRNPDGSVVFRADDIEVPSAWSQVAVDVLAQKYFRKAGVPQRLARVEDKGVPEWLRPSRADAEALEALPADQRYGSETSARQVFDRLAGTWTYWGLKGGYFDAEEDAL